jgi:hypothetical protein
MGEKIEALVLKREGQEGRLILSRTEPAPSEVEAARRPACPLVTSRRRPGWVLRLDNPSA